jgi:hypothetical protein
MIYIAYKNKYQICIITGLVGTPANLFLFLTRTMLKSFNVIVDNYLSSIVITLLNLCYERLIGVNTYRGS